MKLLAEEGVDFERVDYFVEPMSAAHLQRLLAKAGLPARAVLRKRDPAYAELGLDDEGLGEATLIDAIVRHPGLLQRPIVERGERAVLGRPIEAVRALL